MSDVSISVRLLKPFSAACQGALERGAVWRGPEVPELDDATARVPHDRALAMLEAAIELTGDPALPLRAARLVEHGALDCFGFIAQSASTPRQCLEAVQEHGKLVHGGLCCTLATDDDEAVLGLSLASGLSFPREAAEFGAALAVCCVELWTGGVLSPSEVRFRHAQPAHREAYREIFSCPVRFGAERDEVIYPAARLDLPLERAQELPNEVLDQHARRWVRERPVAHAFSAAAQAQIRRGLERRQTGLGTVARSLGVSARTLRRRLHEEHSSYGELLDAARFELAVAHLKADRQSISEIAELLGFSRLPSFYRAFRRWTGATPGEYRKRLTSIPPPPPCDAAAERAAAAPPGTLS